MLLLQQYLQNHSLDELKEEFSIIVNQSKKYPELYLFKYDQIKSPLKHPLVQECRGIILNSNPSTGNDWSVVSYPFNKFFNLGENIETEKLFDWNNYKVYPKLDGSLISLYFYDNKWNIASSGNPDASGSCTDSNLTFYEAVDYWLPSDLSFLNTHFTYIFELVSKYNKNVVIYNNLNYGLYLIGIRNNKTLQELDISNLDNQSYFKLNTHFMICKELSNKEIYKQVNDLKGHEAEGYILVDKDFNRIKVKSTNYVALHHLKSSWSLKSLIQIVLNNEIDEVVNYFPEFGADLRKIKDWLEVQIQITLFSYLWNCKSETKKEFALKINPSASVFKNLLFNAYDLKLSNINDIKEFFRTKIYTYDINKLEKLYKE